MGVQAVTKAGTMLSDRFAKRKASANESDVEVESDIAVLQDALEALPTRHELAEAIAALDEQAELRARQQRQLILGGLLVQTLILGGLILAF